MNKTIFELLYSTGIRVNELVNLKLEDLRLNDNMINIINAKGRKDRVCVLTNVSKIYIKLFITKVRNNYIKDNKHNETQYVFTRTSGKKLSSSDIETKIKRYISIAGIKKHISCHAFRRSLATHLLEQNVSVRYIQNILGHKNINTTLTYLKVSTNKLREILLTYHPREKYFLNKEVKYKGEKRTDYAVKKVSG